MTPPLAPITAITPIKMPIEYLNSRDLPVEAVVGLYRANGWSSAEKPEKLMAALRNSDSVVSAWDGKVLVGLGNAISDGHLVVYYPHLLVLPTHHKQGIGRHIMDLLKAHYGGFHQHILVSDSKCVGYYQSCGFELAGATQAMWIYHGNDHS